MYPMVDCQCEISWEEMKTMDDEDKAKWWEVHEKKRRTDRDGNKIMIVKPTCNCESWIY